MAADTSHLAAIVAALRAGQPVPKKPRTKTVTATTSAKKALPPPLPYDKAYALKCTGYITWRALAKVVEIQEQICLTCGENHSVVRGEFYKLENGTAHAIWLRPEGYGISAQENLPIEFSFVEPRNVIACATCADETIETHFIRATSRAQLELPI